MKKLSLTLISLLLVVAGFSQTPCSQLNASFTLTQTGNGITITNTSTLPTGGTYPTSYAWVSYGDGTSSSANPTATHTYNSNGTFTITFYQSWSDSTTVNYVNCTDTATQTVTITTAPASPCAFTINSSNNGSGTYTFTASSSTSGLTYNWTFGDGTTATGNPVSHTYTNYGYYVVWATASGSSCGTNSDSTTFSYSTPTTSTNEISGSITYDSTFTNSTVSFKVWLIEESYDSTAMSAILTAVDSLTTPAQYYWANYQFNNVPAGIYYTKARVAPGTTNPGLVPTYHQSSAIWSSATAINHTGGSSIYKHINMIAGTATTGPGFIGGNVSQGAGKGTNAGIANLSILLRDANDNVIASTYTDANGDYSFGSIASGAYTIYPEEMNYQTTPSASLMIGSGVNTYNSIDFEKNSNSIKPKTTGVKDVENTIFSIYPNPTKGQVNINWKNGITGDVQILVTDIAGRTIYNQNVTTAQSTQLDLSKLNQGIYFIKVNTVKGQYTERIVLQ